MTFRVYLIVAICFGLFIFLVSTVFGDDIVAWARQTQFEAAIRGQTLIEVVVMEPVIFVFGERPWGPIVGGLAWPAVIAWLFFILMSLLIIAGVDVGRDIESVT